MTVWNNKHSLTKHYVCQAPIVQIRSAVERSNLFVFSEDGYVHHVDGYDFKTICSTKISKNRVVCVEEVSVKDSRGFMVADDKGNLSLFNTSFDCPPRNFGKRKGPVTAIQCLGRERVLISYSNEKNMTRIEMISFVGSGVISQVDLTGTRRIKDFHCPDSVYGKYDCWVMAGSDNCILTIGVTRFKLKKKHVEHLIPGFCLDELVCDRISKHYVGKEMVLPDVGEKYDNVPYAYDEDDKMSTISLDHDIKIITEMNNLFVKGSFGKVNKYVDLGEDEIVVKHLHNPLGRIVCGTPDGRLIVVDFRMNSIRFIQDA